MERKRKTTGSHNRPPSVGQDLVARRKKLLETYFENGRQIAGELLQEIDAARRRLQELENDNSRLRLQLKSDTAIRDLINKIENLESERGALLTHSEEAARQARSELARAAAVESELSNLASLYVASSQLHGSLEPREVVQTMGQLLLQFVGAGAYAIYSVDGDWLVPVASEGVATSQLRRERVGQGPVGSCLGVGEMVVALDRADRSHPIVSVPLRIGDDPVAVVAIYELLEQKNALEEVDFELLRMLAVQGAAALAGARLYAAAAGVLPALPAEQFVGARDAHSMTGQRNDAE